MHCVHLHDKQMKKTIASLQRILALKLQGSDETCISKQKGQSFLNYSIQKRERILGYDI
mgnify:CR=1 FL=1